jgi:hypothetical protein
MPREENLWIQSTAMAARSEGSDTMMDVLQWVDQCGLSALKFPCRIDECHWSKRLSQRLPPQDDYSVTLIVEESI